MSDSYPRPEFAWNNTAESSLETKGEASVCMTEIEAVYIHSIYGVQTKARALSEIHISNGRKWNAVWNICIVAFIDLNHDDR